MDSKIYQVKLDNGIIYFAHGPLSLGLQSGDFCVFQKDFYLDYGRVVSEVEKIPENRPNTPTIQTTAPVSGGGLDGYASQWNNGGNDTVLNKKTEMLTIQRKANVNDRSKANENQIRSRSAMKSTQKFVDQLKLNMKLINAHFTFDGKLLLIQFSADGRVDFRELVKLLAKEFNTHIELRQIGVRDETSILGGIANCGQPLCCCRFLSEFDSINVKMAKEQDLSLTPSTISGVCGRLKCCLKYEHEGYVELEKTMPRRGDICECKDGRGRIVDRNLLTQTVTVLIQETSHMVVCPVSDISIVYLDKYKLKNQQQSQEETPAIGSPYSDSVNLKDAKPEAGLAQQGNSPMKNQADSQSKNQMDPNEKDDSQRNRHQNKNFKKRHKK